MRPLFTSYLDLIRCKVLIFLCCFLGTTTLSAQLSNGGTPLSFKVNLQDQVPIKEIPGIDLQAIQLEDAQAATQDCGTFRFAIPFSVNYSLQNSGAWKILPNGDRVWRLNIHAPGALNINLLYSDFYMPEGAELFLYSSDKRQVLGAFTYRNNKIDGRFATALIFDDFITLEYFEPAAVKGQGRLAVSQVAHGYRGYTPNENAEDIGDSGGCQVNVNCVEGDDWQEEKKSVAKITVNGTDWCTGSLVNNTALDCSPLFLTADHCRSGQDAISNPIASTWVFYWNFERPGCANTGDVPVETTAGATFLANASPSDFAILLLDENPADQYEVYFNGWNATDVVGSSGVGIHHPSGDVKKIATHSLVPAPDNWAGNPIGTHWEVLPWDATQNGHSVTEGGSSGSPLFDNNKRVIGQLHGGSSINCSNPPADPGVYGAMWWSWDNSGNGDNRRRLKDWLDPIDSGILTLDGSANPCGPGGGIDCGDLFISEYMEGSDFNRCIELYNPRGEAMDLAGSNYQLQFYFDGSASPGAVIDLDGTVGSGDVFVVCASNADADLVSYADQTSGVTFFDGNDAVELLRNGVAIDVIGQIGVNPGNAWGTGSTSTKDNTLLRIEDFLKGAVDHTAGFDPADEWDGFGIDYAGTLGGHVTSCAEEPDQDCRILNLAPLYSCNDNPAGLVGIPGRGTFSGPGVSNNFFDPAAAGVGIHLITYSSLNGDCERLVTVVDDTGPTLVCEGTSIDLDQGDTYVIQDSDVLDLASLTDDCGQVGTINISPSTISCANVGTLLVSVSASDDSGNLSTCFSTVTISCQTSGDCSFTGLPSVASCDAGPITLVGNPAGGVFSGPGVTGNTFDPSLAGLGTHTVLYSVNGNICANEIVDVVDDQGPSLMCLSTTIDLAGTGSYTLTVDDVLDLNNSFDNCGGITVLSISPNLITNSNVGNVVFVEVTVSDDAGNIGSCFASVTVEDSQSGGGWIGVDIGNGQPGGSFTETGDIISVNSNGGQNGGSGDNGFFVYQEICGIESFTARVSDLCDFGLAGIEFREGTSETARKITLLTNTVDLVQTQRRLIAGFSVTTQNFALNNIEWLRLERGAFTTRGYTSTDGVNWTILFNYRQGFSNCLNVGLFVESNNPGQQCSAVFDNITFDTGESSGEANLHLAKANNNANIGQPQVSVFPNPTKNRLTVQWDFFDGEDLFIEIMDTNGRIIDQRIEDPNNHQTHLDLSENNIVPGVYFLRLRDRNKTVTRRFLKQ